MPHQQEKKARKNLNRNAAAKEPPHHVFALVAINKNVLPDFSPTESQLVKPLSCLSDVMMPRLDLGVSPLKLITSGTSLEP